MAFAHSFVPNCRPSPGAAPRSDGMRGRLASLLVAVAFVAIAGTTAPAVAKKRAKPSPSPVAQPNIAPGYYLMLGNQIVSPRYSGLPACLKDLSDAKHRLVPGSDMIACVHRTQ